MRGERGSVIWREVFFGVRERRLVVCVGVAVYAGVHVQVPVDDNVHVDAWARGPPSGALLDLAGREGEAKAFAPGGLGVAGEERAAGSAGFVEAAEFY
jgi:hypothetical protein